MERNNFCTLVGCISNTVKVHFLRVPAYKNQFNELGKLFGIKTNVNTLFILMC